MGGGVGAGVRDQGIERVIRLVFVGIFIVTMFVALRSASVAPSKNLGLFLAEKIGGHMPEVIAEGMLVEFALYRDEASEQTVYHIAYIDADHEFMDPKFATVERVAVATGMLPQVGENFRLEQWPAKEGKGATLRYVRLGP